MLHESCWLIHLTSLHERKNATMTSPFRVQTFVHERTDIDIWYLHILYYHYFISPVMTVLAFVLHYSIASSRFHNHCPNFAFFWRFVALVVSLAVAFNRINWAFKSVHFAPIQARVLLPISVTFLYSHLLDRLYRICPFLPIDLAVDPAPIPQPMKTVFFGQA